MNLAKTGLKRLVFVFYSPLKSNVYSHRHYLQIGLLLVKNGQPYLGIDKL